MNKFLAIFLIILYDVISDKRKEYETEQKSAARTQEKAEKDRNSKEASKAANFSQKKKLTYKEQKELEQLEKDLESLAAEKAELEETLNSGTLPYEELQKTSERIGQILELTDEKEFRLLELYESM